MLIKRLSSIALKFIFHLFLLAIFISCGNAARILNEDATLTSQPIPPPEQEAVHPLPSPLKAAEPPDSNPTTVTKVETTLSFFMHDIFGGSSPSGRIVAGITATTQTNGIPFSKPKGGIFPIRGGIPLVTNNHKGITNGPNLPFITGLNGGKTSTVINNNGNNNLVVNGKNLPFVTAGQIPAGASLQELMFGTITAIDDELTEGHELGASVIGKAQGFYLASSMDGSSHTMAFTALLNGDDKEEKGTLSFFGVHRTASHESLMAIVGGTGKYENAKGYAKIETQQLPDQHTTDGVDTIIQFTVYLTL